MIRPYLDENTYDRIVKYAANTGVKLNTKSGIANVHTQLINSILDEKGNTKDRLVLTDGQNKIIQDIALAMGCAPEKIAQELINNALLIYTTHISLREVLVAVSPHIMNDLVLNNPDVAKEVLQGLRGVGKK